MYKEVELGLYITVSYEDKKVGGWWDHFEYPTPALTDGDMFNLLLQISSIPSFKPQVSKIERTERIFSFSDPGSCAVDCPIAGRDPARNVARFK